MRKKPIPLLLALTLTATLAACGGGEDSAQTTPSAAPSGTGTTQTAPTEAAAPATAERYTFPAGTDGFQVSVDQDMDQVLTALGEPQSYFEAASCAFEGLDKTYTYAGFAITTRPEGEKDFVNSILLTDDSVTTAEGLYIGSTAEEVTAVYGESAGATDTLLTYTAGDTVLQFVLSGGTVVSIEYLPR